MLYVQLSTQSEKLYTNATRRFAHLRGFHDDWANIATSRVHVIQLTGTIFELNSHIKETNVLTKLHEKWANNVTSRVFTCFHYIHTCIEKNALPTGGHPCYATDRTIFELNSHIKETNVLTKFHENLAKNVTFRVEKCPTHWRPCLSTICTIFKLVRDINKTNVLSNFHDDWAKIVTFRVFTRKTALPTGGHVFQLTGTTFELNQHIIKTIILTNDLVFDPAQNPYFQLDRDFIGTKLLTKFHEDRTINVASRVFTNKCGRTDDGRTDDRQRPVTKAHLSNQMS
ncbi:hypothetical protein DPMN_028451 [Dreissena polymorpha]|uniref:Uncharacterized protein n=1 Tax=Dreissena polymorpha TaxID=45954 RepID=A0A9D4RG61_DREPO|nr:hypothetical protein DPMN_028451 [Dreissena polymorpha]